MTDKETPKEATDSTKTPWTPEVRNKFETKYKSEFLDPCQEAAQMSIRCLHRNNGQRALCQDYFEAYRNCKKLWIEKRKEDKRKSNGGGLFW